MADVMDIGEGRRESSMSLDDSVCLVIDTILVHQFDFSVNLCVPVWCRRRKGSRGTGKSGEKGPCI